MSNAIRLKVQVLLNSKVYPAGVYEEPTKELIKLADSNPEYATYVGSNNSTNNKNIESKNDESDKGTVSYDFISVEEYKAMKQKDQLAYIEKLDKECEDEKGLYDALINYKEVSKEKAVEAINDILATYEE